MNRNEESPETLALLENAAWVRRLARHLLADAHLAEDVTQDVLTVALEQPPPVSGNVDQLRRWLGGVTRHLAARVRRREGDRARHEARASRAESDGDGAADRLLLHRRLVEAVLALDEPYRTTVILRFFDDLPPREIARREGIASTAVRQRLSRGLAMLRARLDREFEGGRRAWGAALGGLLGAGSGVGGSPAAALAPLVLALIVLVAAFVGWQRWSARDSGLGGTAPISSRGGTVVVERAEEESTAVASGASSRTLVPDTALPLVCDSLEIHVQTEDGEAVEAADVTAVVDGAIVDAARTDNQGCARFAGRDKRGLVAVHAAGRPAEVLVLEELRGRQECTLAAGAVLSGRVLVDGAPASEPLELQLEAIRDRLPAVDERTRAVLATIDGFSLAPAVTTGPGGSFWFEGLPVDWAGSLLLPRTHWFTDTLSGSIEGEHRADRRSRLGPPERGLVLRTTRLPTVRGRTVHADTGQAMGDIEALVTVWFVDGTVATDWGFMTDPDGCFVSGLAPGHHEEVLRWRQPELRPAMEKVRFYVRGGPFASPWFERYYQADEIGPGGDLGDIPLPRGRTLHLRVMDGAGQPIDGAFVDANGLAGPSSGDGRVVLTGIAPGCPGVTVGAPSHTARNVSIAGRMTSYEEPLEVVLGEGSRMELVLAAAGGVAPRGLVVKIETSEASESLTYAEGDWGLSSKLLRACGAGTAGHSSRDGKTQYGYTFAADGRLFLASLRPHLKMTVSVEGPLGHRAFCEEMETPGPGDCERRELQIEDPSFEPRVTVRDAIGCPLPHVLVQLRRSTGDVSVRTEGDGIAYFPGIFVMDDPATLTAALPGHAPVRIEGLQLGPDTPLPDIVMDSGVELTARVVDEAGNPLTLPFGVTAAAPGRPGMSSLRQSPGVYAFNNLPPGCVSFRVLYGVGEYFLEHDTAHGDAKLVLPVHGTLEVSVPPRLLEGDRVDLQAIIQSLDDASLCARPMFDWGQDPAHVVTTPAPPGRYRIHLEQHPTGFSTPAKRLPGEWTVEVRAGEVTRVAVGD